MTSVAGRLFAIILAFGLAVPSSVSADPPIGSLIDRSSGGLNKRFDPRQATSPRPAINAYMHCVASLNRVKASEVLDHEYGSDKQLALVNQVERSFQWFDEREQDCFSNFGSARLQYDPLLAVGSFSEYFALKTFGDNEVKKISQLSRDDWQWPGLIPRNGSEMFALCVTQAHADLVLGLIKAEPSSADEKAAIQELVPYLGPCLAQGAEVKFDAASLRALLAYGLYRSLSQMEELRKASSK